MTKYLISFDRGWMTFPDEDLADVAAAARAVVKEAVDAGAFVFGGGIDDDAITTLVTVDGTVTDGPYPETKEQIGGFLVLDLPTREIAMEWAARVAVACRCSQELREIMPDPNVDAWLGA